MNELAVVALGGNARRRHTGSWSPTGNDPQVGLLALLSDAYPLDVLGSETEGQIGSRARSSAAAVAAPTA